VSSPVDGILKTFTPPPAIRSGNARLSWSRASIPCGAGTIYVGDLVEIDMAACRSIAHPRRPPRQGACPGSTVIAPPSATALASSLDLSSRDAEPNGHVSPRQRLGVTLALKSDQDISSCRGRPSFTDIHGGSWVYEQLEPTKFVRRRVL